MARQLNIGRSTLYRVLAEDDPAQASTSEVARPTSLESPQAHYIRLKLRQSYRDPFVPMPCKRKAGTRCWRRALPPAAKGDGGCCGLATPGPPCRNRG
ncbi:hypothetical protein [Actinomadura coerulea]|uniref:hypothetical protein n=1 Tax=Actinomadura coerulea TaxID=46159 RepID=UPI00343D8F88